MLSPVKPLAHSPAVAAVTIGFGAAVAMAGVGFFTHLPDLRAPSPVVFFLLVATFLAVIALGTSRVGKSRAIPVGIGAGVLAGLLFLLMVGSVLGSETEQLAENVAANAVETTEPSDATVFRENAAQIALGWLALSAIVGALGGVLGSRTGLHRGDTRADGSPRDWHALYMKIAALSFVPLIVVGGVVTSKEAGMAVPDWPGSFGRNMFLFPLSKMTGGIYYEHAHRLIGSLVGVTVLVGWFVTIACDRRKWMWALVFAGGLFVAAQGYIGGARVFLDNRALAALHGTTGQLIFAFFVAVAAFASVRWKRNEPKKPGALPGCGRFITTLLLVFLTIQLLLGVMTRHFEGSAGYSHVLLTHITNSVLVAAIAIGAGLRTRQCLAPAMSVRSPDALTRIVGTGVMHTTILQMLLGVGALAAVLLWKDSDPWPEVLVTTAHQANGAALLALATLAAVWTRRLVLPKKSAA